MCQRTNFENVRTLNKFFGVASCQDVYPDPDLKSGKQSQGLQNDDIQKLPPRCFCLDI